MASLPAGAQGAQGVVERAGGGGAVDLALGLLGLADGLAQLAEGDVVDGAQQAVLVAAGLHEEDERDGLVPVERGDELHVGCRQRLLDHQNAREHVRRPFGSRAPKSPCGNHPAP